MILNNKLIKIDKSELISPYPPSQDHLINIPQIKAHFTARPQNQRFGTAPAFAKEIDSEMMKFSSLRPSDNGVSPRSGSPHNSVISYDQFIEEIQNFLRDQAIGNPTPVNQ